jgi:hypothetical protein
VYRASTQRSHNGCTSPAVAVHPMQAVLSGAAICAGRRVRDGGLDLLGRAA